MLPAVPENASRLRHALDAWASSVELPEALVETMSLAVYEAMANSVEHAYHDREPGTVAMHAVLSADRRTVEVTVADEGAWREGVSEPGLRGRGIPLMRALAADVRFFSADGGTTVRMTWAPAEFAASPGEH